MRFLLTIMFVTSIKGAPQSWYEDPLKALDAEIYNNVKTTEEIIKSNDPFGRAYDDFRRAIEIFGDKKSEASQSEKMSKESEKFLNEANDEVINIGNEVKVAADIFWGGSCVLDSECFYFTMFGTVFQVSSCDTRSVAILGLGVGACSPRLWVWVSLLAAAVALLTGCCGAVVCCGGSRRR